MYGHNLSNRWLLQSSPRLKSLKYLSLSNRHNYNNRSSKANNSSGIRVLKQHSWTVDRQNLSFRQALKSLFLFVILFRHSKTNLSEQFAPKKPTMVETSEHDCWHVKPVQPGEHLHCPDSWSQAVPLPQKHCRPHPGPYHPLGHGFSHREPWKPGGHWQVPLWGSHVPRTQEQDWVQLFPNKPCGHSDSSKRNIF